MQMILVRLLAVVTLVSTLSLASAFAQDSSRDVTKRKDKAKKENRQSTENEPWKRMPLLLDRPDKAYEVIGLVSAPQIFLWDDEEAMKESLQKQAWKMKADAVILDRVDTSFRFTGPAGGANGRAIRYKE